MKIVSLCFSGQPRAILKYKEPWQDYFAMLRAKYRVRILLHSWSDEGFVKHDGRDYVEGQYERSRYRQFDELIDFLDPEAFQIGTQLDRYTELLCGMGTIYISHHQAAPPAILSQIHKVYLANAVRRAWEQDAGPWDAVVKLRFDFVPTIRMTNEIDYVVDHADYPLFFINRYCAMFPDIRGIYQAVKSQSSCPKELYLTTDEPDNERVKTIVGLTQGEWDVETSPIFIPEKFVRANMSPYLAIHGRSVFEIMRR